MVTDSKNCWEFTNCAKSIRTHCPVFKNNVGDRCWSINSFSPVCSQDGKKKWCFECDWYIKHNKY